MANSSLDKARKDINEIDKQMADLFVRRMRAVEEVAEYKKERGLAILDEAREEEIVRRNSTLIDDEVIREYYINFLRSNMAVSRAYQGRLMEEMKVAYSDTEGAISNIAESELCLGAKKIVHVNIECQKRCYDINIGRGLLSKAGELFDLDRRVFIVTDSGVPIEYARAVEKLCKKARISVIKEGEDSKSIETLGALLNEMLEFGMTRTDCVLAVGGGVVGDLSGFLAASYMRGIDFYNIPTTLLSQVDSSIGGKTAINLGGVKNIVGAFYQPKGVIIDPDTLKTLPKRQIANGLAEAIKMSLTSDGELFKIFEERELDESSLDEIIERSLMIKRSVVERDEREGGLRKILNFGHTFAHAIEAEEEMRGLYHGECVALGMLVCASDEVRERLIPVLKKVGLPTEYKGDAEKALSFIAHDKKCDGDLVSVIFVDTPGSYRIEKMSVTEFCNTVRRAYKI